MHIKFYVLFCNWTPVQSLILTHDHQQPSFAFFPNKWSNHSLWDQSCLGCCPEHKIVYIYLHVRGDIREVDRKLVFKCDPGFSTSWHFFFPRDPRPSESSPLRHISPTIISLSLQAHLPLFASFTPDLSLSLSLRPPPSTFSLFPPGSTSSLF